MRAFLSLARWQNALIAAAGVLVGAWWSARALPSAAWWAALGAIPLTAFANATNDVADTEIDRVAHPGRPLPSGAITRAAAVRFATAAAILAIGFELAASPLLGALSIVVLALMLAYAARLSRVGGIGANLLVALLASLPFFFGAASAGSMRVGLLLVAAAAPLHLARELSKDIEDAPGDAGRRNTVPLVHGEPAAVVTVAVAACMFLAAVILLGAHDRALWLFALPSVALGALALHRVRAHGAGAPRLFKLAMVGMLAALVLTRLVTS
ncbi:MAG: UbiA prenyltransferase [Gemmatimonadetes bacterium]|nr:UbiA prenyltransferase [Gemmatimonadota bacterium]